MPVSAPAREVSATSSCRVLTDRDGRVVDACDSTTRLLNSSWRGLEGRVLPLFVAQDRSHVLSQMEVASRGHQVIIHTILRPKERQPRQAHITIQRVDAHRFAELEWVIELF
jgi:hypothetical protein